MGKCAYWPEEEVIAKFNVMPIAVNIGAVLTFIHCHHECGHADFLPGNSVRSLLNKLLLEPKVMKEMPESRCDVTNVQTKSVQATITILTCDVFHVSVVSQGPA